MVAVGHKTTTPDTLTYVLVISKDSVRIALNFSALNYLKDLASDIQNNYLTEKCRENIWTMEGPDFGTEQVNPMLVVR